MFVYGLQGQWVLLQNAHNNTQLLYKLETILAEVENPSLEFRLFVTSQATKDCIPTQLLQQSIVVTVDTPRVCSFFILMLCNWCACGHLTFDC